MFDFLMVLCNVRWNVHICMFDNTEKCFVLKRSLYKLHLRALHTVRILLLILLLLFNRIANAVRSVQL
jgi:hypothetical protein